MRSLCGVELSEEMFGKFGGNEYFRAVFLEGETMEVRNIALIAHVDHGKTTAFLPLILNI